MQRKHHIWNVIVYRVSALDLFGDEIEPVSQIVCCADPRGAQGSRDLLNVRLALKSADELVHEVEYLGDVTSVGDAIDEVQAGLTKKQPRFTVSPRRAIQKLLWHFNIHVVRKT